MSIDKNFIKSQWTEIESLANEMCQKIQSESTVRDSQWESTKTQLINEGMVQGIKRFYQELYAKTQ